MEIPNRKVLRDIIIDKVKTGWKTKKGKADSLSFKFELKRKEKRQLGGKAPLVTDEWVEPINEKDPRYSQLFYTQSKYS